MLYKNRRNLLKAFGISSGTVATTGYFLPNRWIRPVVQHVVLPAHAEMTGGESACAIYAVEGLPVPTNSSQTFIVCAVLCGDRSVADVRFAPVGVSDGLIPRVRTGMIPTNGTQADMTNTETSPNCLPTNNPTVPATITNLTEQSLTFTLIRPKSGNLEATLLRVESCPTFPSVTGDVC